MDRAGSPTIPRPAKCVKRWIVAKLREWRRAPDPGRRLPRYHGILPCLWRLRRVDGVPHVASLVNNSLSNFYRPPRRPRSPAFGG
jgi:hypothetical protein